MLYFYFMFLDFYIQIFYFIQGFYFVCKGCCIHLNKIFRTEDAETDKYPTTSTFSWLKESGREWQIHYIVHLHWFLFFTCVSLPFHMFIWSVWARHIGNHLSLILFSLHCTNSKAVYLQGPCSIKNLASCDCTWGSALCCWKELIEIAWVSI